MRLACKILAIPVALIVASGTSLIGAWGMPVGAVLLLGACVAAAVAMESKDLASIEGLTPGEREGVAERVLEAA